MLLCYPYGLPDSESSSMHNVIHSCNAMPLILFILFVQVLQTLGLNLVFLNMKEAEEFGIFSKDNSKLRVKKKL